LEIQINMQYQMNRRRDSEEIPEDRLNLDEYVTDIYEEDGAASNRYILPPI